MPEKIDARCVQHQELGTSDPWVVKIFTDFRKFSLREQYVQPWLRLPTNCCTVRVQYRCIECSRWLCLDVPRCNFPKCGVDIHIRAMIICHETRFRGVEIPTAAVDLFFLAIILLQSGLRYITSAHFKEISSAFTMISFLALRFLFSPTAKSPVLSSLYQILW